MTGIVFHATERREAVVEFYRERLGATVRVEQPDCTILAFGGFLFGFCERDEVDNCGILTFVYPDRDAVDAASERLGDAVVTPPRENETYDIYQCFAEDPEGRTVECQVFLDEEVDIE
ncbi:glyoxalase [Halorubrum ezzemoulense]|uniref:Glyoxalase n=1 Tax=Halorubrum ezzemoulense TaxID=337243 RepID=A0A256KSC6_HALEZ|nr:MULTISPECIES: VOC family protein [Halorubrum]MDB9253236.1 VOC family protein [Halorubrum ezzemoulense]MDB9256399.1 VOC family protein [Halorubrum ezzemoulense]MDB9277553.1 VOC family protein [Halorubrum ezzemoulense]MDB9280409.1 VOC family protein [Halorubrum ezzemoulense]MDB9283984.1 VOC family protein [Halorubrum ezzemoulense]